MFSRTLFKKKNQNSKNVWYMNVQLVAGLLSIASLLLIVFVSVCLQGGMGAALLSQPDNVHKVSYTIP